MKPKNILSKTIIEVSANLYHKALTTVPKEVYEELKKAFKRETNELAREQLDQILKNIEAAKEDNNVICQDVGIPTFFVDVGTEFGCKIDIRDSIRNGMKALYEEEPHILTYQVNPIGWKRGASWEGVHTPFVYLDVLPNADYIQLTAFPKGTGSSMWGKLKLYGPNKATLENVRKFVLESLLDAGPRACPPYTIGVGLGGTLDYVTYLAKKATARPINLRHPNSVIAEMEIEILGSVNSLGIGVMGLGGDTTALAVNVDYASTHLYRTPMAFELNCWPNRRAEAKIYIDGTVEYV